MLASHGLASEDKCGQEHAINIEKGMRKGDANFGSWPGNEDGKRHFVGDDGQEGPDVRQQEPLAADTEAKHGDEDTELRVRHGHEHREIERQEDNQRHADPAVQQAQAGGLRQVSGAPGKIHSRIGWLSRARYRGSILRDQPPSTWRPDRHYRQKILLFR
jgi:hypothetical protein